MAAKPVASAIGAKRFVAYFRVSTDKQGVSGLGLEAQHEAVTRHVAGVGGTIVARFEEIESGKKSDRPQIAAALAECRLRRATLVIAKLDRLARNVAFVSGLMESGVDFVACDNPYATRLTIHILAAVAEHEREMISQRTTAALARIKAAIAASGCYVSPRSGRAITRLGNPGLSAGGRAQAYRARRARSAIAAQRAAEIIPFVEMARRAGCSSLSEIAAALTARGVPTPLGHSTWSKSQVARAIARARRLPADHAGGSANAG